MVFSFQCIIISFLICFLPVMCCPSRLFSVASVPAKYQWVSFDRSTLRRVSKVRMYSLPSHPTKKVMLVFLRRREQTPLDIPGSHRNRQNNTELSPRYCEAVLSSSFVCRSWIPTTRYHLFNRLLLDLSSPTLTVRSRGDVHPFLVLARSPRCTMLPAIHTLALLMN